jgi:hypothetical protein
VLPKVVLLAALAQGRVALVSQDHVSLRAAPHDAAPKPVTLWQGDLLEVRGERLGYLQVYDPRRQRPGYVRPSQVHVFAFDATSASDLAAIVAFLRDAPGSESLGIAYVAAYLKVAPVEALGADVFDGLGTMAERLGRRASGRSAVPSDELAGHLDVAASYGVHFRSLEREDRTLLCYDGEAFRRVLALGGTADQRARAALALTRPECVDPSLTESEVASLEAWEADVLEKVDPGAPDSALGNRLRIRRAALHASLAFREARTGKDPGRSARDAVSALASVRKAELADEDQALYAEAAVRVGASRWAAQPVAEARGRGCVLTAAPRQPGETCVRIADTFERCTYGQVWLASARLAPGGDGVALAVQVAPAWTELWVVKKGKGGWSAEVLVPAADGPDVGYVEAAGWSPDSRQILIVREARIDGQMRKSFEVLDSTTLAIKKRAGSADALGAFHRWSDPTWRTETIALR